MLGCRRLFLIFHGNSQYLFSRYMNPDFLHCFVIERQKEGWSCTDPNRSNLTSTILPVSSDVDMMPEFRRRNPDSYILEINVYEHDASNYPRLGLISCVSITQYLLGIYYPSVITPYGLYNKLMKNNVLHLEVKSYVV